MSDDSAAPDDLPSRPEHSPEFQRTISQWTRPELFIAIAAAIVVVGNLFIGDVLLNDYAVSNVAWLISLAVLGAVYFFYAGERRPWHDFYPWIVEMGAWALGLIGAVDFLSSIFDDFASSGAGLFFQIVFYVAAGLAAAGAFQLRAEG